MTIPAELSWYRLAQLPDRSPGGLGLRERESLGGRVIDWQTDAQVAAEYLEPVVGQIQSGPLLPLPDSLRRGRESYDPPVTFIIAAKFDTSPWSGAIASTSSFSRWMLAYRFWLRETLMGGGGALGAEGV